MVPLGLSATLHVTPSSVPVPSPLSLLLMLCAPLCTLCLLLWMGQGSTSGLGESATASSAGRPAPSRTDPAKLVPHTAAPAPTVSLRCEGGGRGRNGRAYASNAYTFRQAGNAEASQAPHHPNPHSSVTAALGAPKHARPGWQSPRVALRGAGSHTPRGPHACMEVHMRGQWWCRHRSQASWQPQAELREAQGTAQGTFTSLFNDFTTTAVTEPFYCYLTVAGRPRTYSEGAAAGLAGTTRRCISATEVPKDARGRAAAVALQIVRARPMVSRAGSKGVRPAGSELLQA